MYQRHFIFTPKAFYIYTKINGGWIIKFLISKLYSVPKECFPLIYSYALLPLSSCSNNPSSEQHSLTCPLKQHLPSLLYLLSLPYPIFLDNTYHYQTYIFVYLSCLLHQNVSSTRGKTLSVSSLLHSQGLQHCLTYRKCSICTC